MPHREGSRHGHGKECPQTLDTHRWFPVCSWEIKGLQVYVFRDSFFIEMKYLQNRIGKVKLRSLRGGEDPNGNKASSTPE